MEVEAQKGREDGVGCLENMAVWASGVVSLHDWPLGALSTSLRGGAVFFPPWEFFFPPGGLSPSRGEGGEGEVLIQLQYSLNIVLI